MGINEILFVSGYWLVYFFLHSMLASFWMKEKIERLSLGIYRYYRITYNLIFTVGLVYILFYLATTSSEYLFEKHHYWQFIGLVLATWGLVLFKLSFKQYSIREFLGFQQSDRQTGQEFTSSGILSHVRHPIYSGTILIVVGFFLFNPKVLNLVTLVCAIIYIIIGIQMEERKLVKEFGQQYEEYKKQVPGLIPRLKRCP